MNPDRLLLAALHAAHVHMPAGELAAQAGLTVPALLESVARLRAAGFEIEDRPMLGLRLIAGPDRLIADDLHARLGVCGIAREIVVFEQTTSTNDVAARLGRVGHPGAVVFAERQTAGRGRFGRKWESAAHEGLWFSILLRPDFSTELWPRLTTWAAVAVAEAVDAAAGVRAGIKWPNDVFVADRKAAGILIESAAGSDGRRFAVVGIGLNVNQAEFPPELRESAVSLRLAAGRRLDRAAVATGVLAALDARLAVVRENFPLLLGEAARRSVLLGGWVRMGCGGEIVEGMAESLDDTGNLMLRLADGSLRRMTAGEVTSRTPDSVPA